MSGIEETTKSANPLVETAAPEPDATPTFGAEATADALAVAGQESTPVAPFTLLTEDDLDRFNRGVHFEIWRKLGAHLGTVDGVDGTFFAVWAPDAAAVSVIGDWNGWGDEATPLSVLGLSGVWAGFVPDVGQGARYKYRITSRYAGYRVDKTDPFAFTCQVPPDQASIVWDLDYRWGDEGWMTERGTRNGLAAPVSIYEVHLGSWRRVLEDAASSPGSPGRPLTYAELGEALADYVTEMGFTHVELLPVMEHPFYGSWGYQVTGYFAATSRYGTPQDLMHLIDVLHRRGIGVLLDWVPSHFPTDEHGLGYFDGTHLFEHADPRLGFHPDWNSLIFNYGRHEVRSFLVSSALFWLDRYHADGLRVDAVASMLYRDYSRPAHDWLPNVNGGRENLEAIDLLRTMNQEIRRRFPDTVAIAEESTAWPLVSRPVDDGGLGFQMKWDMGWMHDTLEYFALDPLFRSQHHGKLTFRAMYAGSENFVLPLSHDEVVHLKGSLLGKMPGAPWERYANLRLLFADLFAQPGKKLLFMGGEIGQWREWNHDASLDWHLLELPEHAGLQALVADLNRLYREEPALHELDARPAEGFEWLDCRDAERSVLAILRRSGAGEEGAIAIVLNFTPVLRTSYRVGLPEGGLWREIANTDAVRYGGTGAGNLGGVEAEEEPFGPWPWSIELTLPPLGALFLKRDPSIPVKRRPAVEAAVAAEEAVETAKDEDLASEPAEGAAKPEVEVGAPGQDLDEELTSV